ncbi:acyltransferase [Leptospira levettii]|uniref:acyltransferase n=1 Tax=Leptospira levettii TaxID=2023178 RepID=UPI001FCBEC81|nr:acyltransferase [Leptospira levettii]
MSKFIRYNLLEVISYVISQIYIKTLLFVSNITFQLKSFFWRVKVGKGYHIFGKIIIYKSPGSKIEIGEDFCSVSNSFRANASTIMAPTCLKTLSPSSKIVIGRGVGVNGVSITARTKTIAIGDGTMIAANVSIMDSDFHSIFPPENRNINPGFEFDSDVIIGKNVWIGTRVIILKGVKIGDNSVIAAGSVVNRSIPENSIAGGVPAKVIKSIYP